MAYGTKYTIETTAPSLDQRIKIYIKERDYTGASTELDPGRNHAVIQYTPIGFYGATPHWNIARSVCTIDFADDTTGKLSEILDGDDEKYQILVENDNTSVSEWSGFVINDSYKYSLYTPAISSLKATDRIEDLQNIPYAQSDGTLYAGRLNLVEIISQCLDSSSLGLGMMTHMNWVPHIGTNDLDTTDDYMFNLRMNQDNFVDNDGNPYSKFSVLQQVLMRFQLQLFQAENKWCIFQRKRNVGINEVDVFKVYNYTSAGVADTPATSNLPGRKEASVDTNSGSFLIAPTATGTVPYGSVKSTYFHGNPFDGLFADLSFEEGLHDTVGGTPLLVGAVIVGQAAIDFDGVTASVNIPADRYFTIAGDETLYKLTVAAEINGSGATTNTPNIEPKIQSAAADNTAMTFHEDIGGWERSDDTTHVTSEDGQNTSEEDTRALKLDVEFVPTASYTKWVRQRSKEDFAGTTGQKLKTGWSIKAAGTDSNSEVYFAFKIYVVGTSNTWYYKRSDSTWPTVDPGAQEITMNGFGWLDEDWHRVDIVTGELNDGSNDISGTLYIEFYEGREHDNTTNSQTVTNIFVDNVDEPVILQSNGLPANEATQTFLTYDGNVNRSEPQSPTFITGDGPTSGHISRLTVLDSTGAEQSITSNWSYLPSTAPSTFTLDQFWGYNIIKQFGVTNRQITASLYTQEGTTTPKPYHYLVIENPDNTTQHDYLWQNLTWRPASHTNVLSGVFVQFQEQISANRICTVDIKPNTSLLSSLSTEQGLVCDTTVEFTPVEGPTHVYWTDANNRVYKAMITSTPEFSPELITTTSDDVSFVRVDQSGNRIFTRETDSPFTYLQARDLEGTYVAEVLEWTSSSPFMATFIVDYPNSRLLLVVESTPGMSVAFYDYEGTLISTHDSEAAGDAGWPGISPDGTDVYYRYERTGASPTDELRKNTVDLPHDPVVSLDGVNDRLWFDDNLNKIFVYASQHNKIIEIPAAGGSESDVKTISISGTGVAYDRLNQKFYYVSAAGEISRCDSDGTNAEVVVTNGATLITSIDLGVF